MLLCDEFYWPLESECMVWSDGVEEDEPLGELVVESDEVGEE